MPSDRTEVSCRFVFHNGGGSGGGSGGDHVDCFIQTSEGDMLITYEASADAAPAIQSALHAPARMWVFRVLSEREAARSAASIVLRRKADHRPLYWTYDGEISGGRGRVAHMGYASVQMSAMDTFGPEIALEFE